MAVICISVFDHISGSHLHLWDSVSRVTQLNGSQRPSVFVFVFLDEKLGPREIKLISQGHPAWRSQIPHFKHQDTMLAWLHLHQGWVSDHLWAHFPGSAHLFRGLLACAPFPAACLDPLQKASCWCTFAGEPDNHGVGMKNWDCSLFSIFKFILSPPHAYHTSIDFNYFCLLRLSLGSEARLVINCSAFLLQAILFRGVTADLSHKLGSMLL